MIESGVTRQISERASAERFEVLPGAVVMVAKQCILDTLGVAIAAIDDEAVGILRAQAGDDGALGDCTLIGIGRSATASQAGLVNGTAMHALDYDDVNLFLNGHPSASMLPGLLALAEKRAAGGRGLVEAFVAGYEAACEIGFLLQPEHYEAGFHNTGTIGTIGASIACGRLLSLDADRMARAIGIAATQAAGLKYQFGTMCKPLHAGLAARNGLLAADLASRGLTSREDVIEASRGFAISHADVIHLERLPTHPAGGYYILSNLFKYHASCFNTHAAIEVANVLRARIGSLENIDRIVILTDGRLDSVCNIADPRTGLETKFSLRHTTALGLAGIDTARLEAFSDDLAVRPDLRALRERMDVRFAPGSMTHVKIDVLLKDGRRLEDATNTEMPAEDLELQRERIQSKFRSLVEPLWGANRAEQVIRAVDSIEDCSDLRDLMDLVGSSDAKQDWSGSYLADRRVRAGVAGR